MLQIFSRPSTMSIGYSLLEQSHWLLQGGPYVLLLQKHSGQDGWKQTQFGAQFSHASPNKLPWNHSIWPHSPLRQPSNVRRGDSNVIAMLCNTPTWASFLSWLRSVRFRGPPVSGAVLWSDVIDSEDCFPVEKPLINAWKVVPRDECTPSFLGKPIRRPGR